MSEFNSQHLSIRVQIKKTLRPQTPITTQTANSDQSVLVGNRKALPGTITTTQTNKRNNLPSATVIAGLCNRCREIFDQVANQFSQCYHNYVHDLIDLANRGCSLCSYLLSKFRTPPKVMAFGTQDWRETRVLYSLHSVNVDAVIECSFWLQTPIPPSPIRLVFIKSDGAPTLGAFFQSSIQSGVGWGRPRRRTSLYAAYHRSFAMARTYLRTYLQNVSSGPIKQVTSPGTGSVASLGLAKRWVGQCVHGHRTCSKESGTNRKLPTRLLRISTSPNNLLSLVPTSNLPLNTPYMTLSHCWGKKRLFTLTTSNIDDLYKVVPSSRLSKTFHDAITITRFMGIEYLWIDSLCIIQDNELDWKHESLLMKDVYTNSYCNIAATHARDGDEGCFVNHEIKCPPFVTIRQRKDSTKIFGDGSYECYDHNLWEDEITNSPLLSRAWVLQERLLAPRVLHFASSQIFFECQEFRACEERPMGLASIDRSFVDKSSKYNDFKQDFHITMTMANRMQLHSTLSACRKALTWSHLINNYTRVELTHESDRLIAISGLVQQLKPLFACRYFAGLWEADFILQLLWWKDDRIPGTRPRSYQAPSWSWASVIGGVIMFMGWQDVARIATGVSRSRKKLETKVKVWDIDVVTKDGNQTGQVTHGSLRMEGVLFPMIYPRWDDISFQGGNFLCNPTLDLASETQESLIFAVLCVYLDPAIKRYNISFHGLLLRPTGKAGQYERIGHLYVEYPKADQDKIFTDDSLRQREGERATTYYETYDERTQKGIFSII